MVDVADIAEDSLADGNAGFPGHAAGPIIVTGSLHVSFPATATGRAFSFAADQSSLTGLTSDALPVHLFVTTTAGGLPLMIGYVGTDPTIAANQVFTISLDANSTLEGTYTFTLLRPLDHPIIGTDDTLNLSINVIASDSTGAPANTTIHVNIVDDTPVIVAANETHSTLTDPLQPTSATQTGSLGISWGADRFNDHVDGGVSTIDGHTGDRSVVFSDALVAATGSAGGTTSTIATLTSFGQTVHYALLDNGTVLLAYTGDVVPALPGTGTGNGDEGPQVSPHVVFVVTLSDASDSGSYVITQYQPLDHNSGATLFDSIDLSFHFTATDSDGDPVSATLTATITDTVPVSIEPVGDHTVVESTLSGGGPDGPPSDGPSSDGPIPLLIKPVLDDNSFVPATTGTVSLNIDWQADTNNPTPGGGVHDRSVAFASDMIATLNGLGLTSNGQTLTYSITDNATGQLLTASAGEGDGGHAVFTVQLSDSGTGSYDFTLLDNLDHPTGEGANDEPLTFNAVATDSDGDTLAVSFLVHVTDDVPVVTGTISDQTAIESTANTPDDNSFQAAITGASLNIDWNSDDNNPTPGAGAHDRSVTFTADNLTTLGALGLTSNGVTITYALSTDGQTLTASAGTHTVFTVQLSDSDNGSYTFTLSDNLDHAPGAGTNDQALSFSFTATDSDGDTTAPASFTVHVTDDVPTIGTADTETVVENTTATPANTFITASATGSLAVDWNSDDNNPTPGAGAHDRSVAFTADNLDALAAARADLERRHHYLCSLDRRPDPDGVGRWAHRVYRAAVRQRQRQLHLHALRQSRPRDGRRRQRSGFDLRLHGDRQRRRHHGAGKLHRACHR